MEQYVVVGGQAEAEEGARLWRFGPIANELLDDPDPRSIQRRAEAAVPLERAYETWTVSEDPAVHVATIQRLLEGGVTQIYIHAPQQDQARVIDFYGRHVLPQFA
ncbi:MAG: hypothetical protein HYX51_03565 [Chloroflexi bacterium]|nr:hypothetical protein [Chloroflexota bacterium]